ncbi:hypothetical protein AXF42_Ash016015 [Apostasia shenzhenica]|uniref:Uncharacterized protein n=1 Tax=Apostasia shenzhenica TaxID=1088818 RepID=A0A2I0B356_9ASPA|nr:hypothetical protein AXF42_Ash016015 [Apostasia shenzhenica]
MARLSLSPPVLLGVLVLVALSPSPPAAVAKEGVSCTMCDSCDNPCLPPASPPPPPPSSAVGCPPPPTTTNHYSPPPPASSSSGNSYFSPPAAPSGYSGEGSYGTPPPPNPILPYFPFLYYSPPPPSKFHAASGDRPDPLGYLIFLLSLCCFL